MYDDVLLAVDGSDVATAAAGQGIAVAAVVDATVHVLTVLEDGTDDDRTTAAADVVDPVADDARDAGRPVETAVRTGRPSREILEYAGEVGADLVVVGTHGRTGLRKLLLGSVAFEVLRDARVPVLTVGPSVTDGSRPFEDVVIAADGRPGTTAAVDQGIGLAERYGARVHAVSVVDDSRSHLPIVLEAFEATAARAVRDVEVRAARRGLDTRREISRGRPADAIVSYAADAGADLIVVGAERLSGLERAVIGSVSQRVVSGASVPVLTVRTVAD